MVGLGLCAWILLRGARSTPTRLMALLVGCLAELQGFEFLWLRHGTKAYVHLQFVGVALAPCVLFHYAISLAGTTPGRRGAAASAYAFGLLFIGVAVGGLWSERLAHVFWEPTYHYNTTYIAIFAPLTLWAGIELLRGRLGTADRRIRGLYTYPLIAILATAPTGFLELSSELGWNPPKLASFGCLAGSVVFTVGVMRNRSIYDAFALLRKDAASVLRANVQGILYVEPDGSLLFSNRLARTLLGLEKDPRTLQEAGIEIPPEGRAVFRRDGRVLEMRVVKSAEVIPAGRLSLILQDKTRDYEMLQQLASKETLAALGEAAATLAHEIRNPLTTLKASLDCATQDLDGGRAPERRHLELASSEAGRLNELLERSLQFSRPLELRRESCDVGALLVRMVERMPPVESRRLAREIESPLPPVQADPDLLAQLFANLLKNAAEAAREIRVSARRNGDRIVVAVFSAGARIPDDVLPRLFEPFVTSKARGTGLGLALCRKIASAHGASLEGCNADGGVLFEVGFPI
ncbi:MAG: hypothetical protein HY293_01805 [Planctomycetes bacterium]|nr:hypothetical protein [Planctomycetota bacterium]